MLICNFLSEQIHITYEINNMLVLPTHIIVGDDWLVFKI